ncbi:tetratricopeptide repeat protein, partial [bacterium]|nr:tetratricopeptide repeat protein [bacterium]
GIFDVAKGLLQQEFNSGNKAEACYYLGNISFLENKKDSARFYFNEGLKANPLYSQNTIGILMLDMNGMDPELVDASLTKIIKDKINKKNIAIPIAASYAFLYNNNTEKANVYFDKAKSVNSKSPDLFLLKGDIVILKQQSYTIQIARKLTSNLQRFIKI